VSLENVLVEFSPLEWAFREMPGDDGYSPRQWRAVWLVRNENTFWMTLFVTVQPGAGTEIEVTHIEYDAVEHAFFLVDADGARTRFTDSAEAKPLFVTLAVLRELSACVKPDPMLSMVIGKKGYLPVRPQTAKLVRPLKDDQDLRLHFVRYLHSGGRYEGPLPLNQALAVLQLDLASPFESLSGLEKVYGRTRKAELGDRTVSFPWTGKTGHSAGAAKTLLEWFPSGFERKPGPKSPINAGLGGKHMTTIPSDKAWVLGLFKQMLEEKTPDDRLDFVFRHPVLLSAEALKILLASEGETGALAGLDELRLNLWDHPEQYPRDRGPLNGAIEGLRSRALTLAEARARVVQLQCAGLLSNTYIKVVYEPLLSEVWDGASFPSQAAELVLDSAWAMPFENLAQHVRLAATRGFILVVHAALTQFPDGQLLRRAHEAGAWCLKEVDWSAILPRRSDMLHELGVMDLDAYTSRWPAAPDYLEIIAPWLARATNPMPSPAVALARASDLLAEGAKLRPPGSERGTTLKALLQAKIFEAVARRSDPDPDELGPIASGALENLSPEVDTEAWQWVQNAVDVFALK